MPHARSAGQEGHCEHSAWLMCSTTYFEPMLRHGTGWNTRFSTGFVHFGVPDWGIWGNDISSDSSKKNSKTSIMPFTGVHVRSPAKHVRLQAANLENKCLYRNKCPRKTTQVYLCMSDSSELFESFSLLAGAKRRE